MVSYRRFITDDRVSFFVLKKSADPSVEKRKYNPILVLLAHVRGGKDESNGVVGTHLTLESDGRFGLGLSVVGHARLGHSPWWR
jgi:hypothetical protein